MSNASESATGVVRLASDADIATGTGNQVLTVDRYKALTDAIGAVDTGVLSVSSTNTINVSGTDAITLEVKDNLYCPYDFSSLTESVDLTDKIAIQKTNGTLNYTTVNTLLSNVTPPSVPTSLNDLTDVDTGSVTTGDILVYTTDKFEPSDVIDGGEYATV